MKTVKDDGKVRAASVNRFTKGKMWKYKTFLLIFSLTGDSSPYIRTVFLILATCYAPELKTRHADGELKECGTSLHLKHTQ